VRNLASNYNFNLDFKINRDGLEKAKQDIERLKSEIQSNPAKFNIEAGGIDEAIRQVEIFQKAMEKAFNQDLGRLNTTKFLQELKKADSSLSGLQSEFNKLGIDASNSFNKVEQSIEKTGLSLKKANKLVDSMGVTLTNTIKWNLASGFLNQLGNGVLGAIGYTKSLDNSLNNIRIVTENAAFARRSYSTIRRIYGISPEVAIRRSSKLKKHVSYAIMLTSAEVISKIFNDFKINDFYNGDFDRINVMLKKTCCKKSFLRAAFLTGGSISDPEKTYHLEIASHNVLCANTIKELLKDYGINVKININTDTML
jgi:hypothetical protein